MTLVVTQSNHSEVLNHLEDGDDDDDDDDDGYNDDHDFVMSICMLSVMRADALELQTNTVGNDKYQ